MGEAGAAVQAQQRGGLGVVAHRAVPDLAAGHVDVALFALHEAPPLLTGVRGGFVPLVTVIDRPCEIDKVPRGGSCGGKAAAGPGR